MRVDVFQWPNGAGAPPSAPQPLSGAMFVSRRFRPGRQGVPGRSAVDGAASACGGASRRGGRARRRCGPSSRSRARRVSGTFGRIPADPQVEEPVRAARQLPGRDPGEVPRLVPDSAFVRVEGGREAAVGLCRGSRPGLRKAAGPLRGGGRGDVESGGNGVAGFATLHGRNDVWAKVVGAGFGHCPGPPGCDARIESGFGPVGSPNGSNWIGHALSPPSGMNCCQHQASLNFRWGLLY